MKRADLVEKILDIKREKGWTWKHITDEIGGMSPMLVVGALLGQMKLPKPLAEKAASLFGLSESEKRMLNEVPMRGTPMPPTDPLIYRFYEMVMVNGPALKALIEEEFGDGIMSAIDFDLEIDRLANAKGDRVRLVMSGQVPAVQILWRRAGRAGIRVQGGVSAPLVARAHWAKRRGANSAKAYIHTMSVAIEHKVVIETVAATRASSQRYSPARI